MKCELKDQKTIHCMAITIKPKVSRSLRKEYAHSKWKEYDTDMNLFLRNDQDTLIKMTAIFGNIFGNILMQNSRSILTIIHRVEILADSVSFLCSYGKRIYELRGNAFRKTLPLSDLGKAFEFRSGRRGRKFKSCLPD